MGYGARLMAVEVGTTGPEACRRPSAFRFASIRAIRIPSGRCRSTATWPDVFRPTQLQQSGDHATAAKAGRRCAKVCRRRAVSSLCSVKRWRVTNAIQRESISAQTVDRSSRVSMKVRIGRRSHVTCQRYLLLNHSHGDDIYRSTTSVSMVEVSYSKRTPKEKPRGRPRGFRLRRCAAAQPCASTASSNSATILVILIIGFTAGPAVSL